MKMVIGTMLVALVVATAAAPRRATGQATPPPASAKEKTKAKPKGEAVDYYPLKAGTRWQYQIETGNGQKVPLTYQIGGIERIEGKELARLEVLAEGQKSPYTEHLHGDDGGVFRDRMHNLEFSPPLCLIKYPVKPGERWVTDITVGGRKMRVEGTEGPAQDVKVPAGKYRAIPCSIVVSDGKDKSTNVFWFAAGVGIIKQETDLGTRTIVMELTRYEPAPSSPAPSPTGTGRATTRPSS